MDSLTQEQRSERMSRVAGKNTKPEMLVRSIVHRLGFRFRLHRSDLPGSPDLVLPKHRAVIFVHGCFWHRHGKCRKLTVPASNPEFWKRKFADNVRRDRENQLRLKRLGWRVLIVWECETRTEAAARKIDRFLSASRIR